MRIVRGMLRYVCLLVACAVALVVGLGPAQALEPIVVDTATDRVEITTRGDVFNNRGDSLQVETVAGPDGVVGRMEVRATNAGTNPNWIVFALTNNTDRHMERWLTADRYTSAGSGGVWPDLDASRIASLTPSIGFVPERVKSDRADVFRITLEPGQTITFVAELSSERFSRIFLWKPLAYELKVRERQLFNGTLLGLTGLLAIFLTAIFAANHKAIFPVAALVAWCVLAYLCVDFGFFHKLFNLRPEDNAVYRAAGEASIAASLVIFLYTFLRLGFGHGLIRMLFGVWILAQLALVAIAVVDPRLSATFARLSFLLIGGAGAAIILILALRGQDRAMSLVPTWLLFLVWIFGTAVTLTGRMSGDIVVAGLAAGLVLVVVLIGFTVTQFAFRSLEPAYASAPDEQQIRALAVDGVGAATWEWSARRDEIKVSPVLEAQLGLNHGELSAKVDEYLQHMHSGDRDRFRQVLSSIQERAGGRIRVEFRLRHSDNSYRWFELEAASVESADRRNVRCVGLVRDVTDLKRTHERLLQDAVHCRVTNLPNREIFLDRLRVASHRAQSDPSIRPTIIFIDLDRLRSVNANMGPMVGDSLLLTISRRLKRHVGELDTLSRIGGDQFALLLLNAQDPKDLAGLAERIRRSLRSPINIAAQDVVVTGSLGIAVYEGNGMSPEDLLKGAEIAMYRAKRKGADRIEIFSSDMRTDTGALPFEPQELSNALNSGQIDVHYQPIVYLPTEELAGFEAVLKWEHPKLGAVSHDTIIEAAEKGDLVRKVGGHLLVTGMEAAKVWQRLLPRTEAALFVSVSISNAQLFRPEIVEEWRQLIGRQIVSPESVRLEIAESLAMDNPERAVEMMRVLGAAGAEIVLDEFGAGYTSLPYLQRFPIDTLKIDKSIVQAGTAGEGDGGAVVRSMASLAHELGKKVLAEGVEIEEDVIFLRAIGCEYGQGLYYGEPMPRREVEDLVKLIAKSEKKLEAPALFRTRPKKTKRKAPAAEQPTAGQAPAAGPRPISPAVGPGAGEAAVPRAPAANGSKPPSFSPSTRQPPGRPSEAPGSIGAVRNGSGGAPPLPASASPPPAPARTNGAGRPTAEDAIKDAQRVMASMPNLTVRPIDRPVGGAPKEPDTVRLTAARSSRGAVPPPIGKRPPPVPPGKRDVAAKPVSREANGSAPVPPRLVSQPGGANGTSPPVRPPAVPPPLTPVAKASPASTGNGAGRSSSPVGPATVSQSNRAAHPQGAEEPQRLNKETLSDRLFGPAAAEGSSGTNGAGVGNDPAPVPKTGGGEATREPTTEPRRPMPQQRPTAASRGNGNDTADAPAPDYSHLPPGIAASLARLAGKTAGASGSGAKLPSADARTPQARKAPKG